MATLATLYLTAEKLEILLKTVKAKNEKGVEITISLNDELNKFDQNVSAYVSQSKEQREAKKEKFYVGNGQVIWTKGETKTAKELKDNSGQKPTAKKESQKSDFFPEPEGDSMPF